MIACARREPRMHRDFQQRRRSRAEKSGKVHVGRPTARHHGEVDEAVVLVEVQMRHASTVPEPVAGLGYLPPIGSPIHWGRGPGDDGPGGDGAGDARPPSVALVDGGGDCGLFLEGALCGDLGVGHVADDDGRAGLRDRVAGRPCRVRRRPFRRVLLCLGARSGRCWCRSRRSRW